MEIDILIGKAQIIYLRAQNAFLRATNSVKIERGLRLGNTRLDYLHRELDRQGRFPTPDQLKIVDRSSPVVRAHRELLNNFPTLPTSEPEHSIELAKIMQGLPQATNVAELVAKEKLYVDSLQRLKQELSNTKKE